MFSSWVSRDKVVEYRTKREELLSIPSKKLKIALKEADEQEIESEKSRRELLRAFVEMQKSKETNKSKTTKKAKKNRKNL